MIKLILLLNSVVNIFNNDKSIINIKKNLNVLCILKTNNLRTPKKIIKNSIEKIIIDFITDSYTYAVGMIKLIKNKFNLFGSITYIYKVLNKNNYSYKKIKINSNQHFKKNNLIRLKIKFLKLILIMLYQ